MAGKPFGPTLKTLVESSPGDWPVLLGQPAAPTTVIDADIATVPRNLPKNCYGGSEKYASHRLIKLFWRKAGKKADKKAVRKADKQADKKALWARQKGFCSCRVQRPLGRPDAQTNATLKDLDDLARLEELIVRLPLVASWQKLLGQPVPRRRPRRRHD